jgi:hypothetical protein
MPSYPPPSRNIACRSLATKVRVYTKAASLGAGPIVAELHGLPEYAASLAQHEDIATLRALGKEVDKWLRELHAPAEALLLVAKLRSAGVDEEHLPVLPAAKKLRSIAERGSIRSKSEADLTRSVLANTELSKRLQAVNSRLRVALAAWHTRGKPYAEA